MTNDGNDHEEPSIEDWIAVGDGLRRSMNRFARRLGMAPVPPITHADRIPTPEELAGYEAICPGSAEKLRQYARDEMTRRKTRELILRHPMTWPARLARLAWLRLKGGMS